MNTLHTLIITTANHKTFDSILHEQSISSTMTVSGSSLHFVSVYSNEIDFKKRDPTFLLMHHFTRPLDLVTALFDEMSLT